jgi:hypothetical protein
MSAASLPTRRQLYPHANRKCAAYAIDAVDEVIEFTDMVNLAFHEFLAQRQYVPEVEL